MKKVHNPIIAVMTDFGEEDYFVPSLKGVIACINPEARIIGITHSIPSFDVLAGSFVLFAAYRYFPPKTIFLAIVDPGVGSNRKIIMVETARFFFIAPDNGILSLVLEEEEVIQVREMSDARFFLRQTGVTFEGRDKMAPAAGWLSQGIFPDEFGPKAGGYTKILTEKPSLRGDEILGDILYREKFGNLITNIPSPCLDPIVEKHGTSRLRLALGDQMIRWGESYSAVTVGEPVFLSGSLGLVEIAVREGSAFESLRAKPGDKVKIVLLKQSR